MASRCRVACDLFSPLRQRTEELAHNVGTILDEAAETPVEMHVRFATPLSTTPLVAAAQRSQRRLALVGSGAGYLREMAFPAGVDVNALAAGQSTYLRLICDPLPKDSELREQHLERLADRYRSLLAANIADPEFLRLISQNTIGHMISEMCANVADHADALHVYMFAQYWPRLNDCEVCLIDDGIGLLASLQRIHGLDSTHEAMVRIVTEGLSSKDEFGTIKRGTGIRSTIRLLTNEVVRGEFVLISGDAAMLCTAGAKPQIVEFTPQPWTGTIVGMRFRKPTELLDYYECLRGL